MTYKVVGKMVSYPEIELTPYEARQFAMQFLRDELDIPDFEYIFIDDQDRLVIEVCENFGSHRDCEKRIVRMATDYDRAYIKLRSKLL